MKKTMSRALSLILAVVMLAMSLPIVFAATSVMLTQSNVTEWPKATPKLTEGVFYGQTVGSAVELTGGAVTYNGTTVSGHFEFVDPNSVVNKIGSIRCDIKFVPENTDEYTGFEALRNRNVTFVSQRTTPVLKDENNPPVASGSYEPGITLSSVTISGGEMVNPYNAEESYTPQASWQWVNPNTVVNGSGEYEVSYTANSSYNTVTRMVYVEVVSPIPVPEISDTPVVEPFDFNPEKTWGQIEIKGGKATADGTEVAGTFAVTDEWKNVVATPGTYEIDVVFTPDDETQAFEKIFKITVTVNAAPITFETEDGTGVPTITVDYGKKTNDDMGLMLKQYVPEDVQIQYIDFYGLDGQLLEHANKIYDPGTYTLTCRGLTQNKNYATTMLTFNLVVTPITITPAIEGNGNRMIIRDVKGQYNPKGTFDLYINDELVKEDIPYNEYFTWEHTTSGDKNFKAVYKPGDDNRYDIDPITRNDTGIILEWNVVANNTEIAPKKYAYNSAVTLAAPAYDPATPDKPYYGFAGWEDVNGNTGLAEEQLKNAEITFTMPDADVEFKATYKFSIKLFFEWILAQITQFFTFIVNAVKDLIALA